MACSAVFAGAVFAALRVAGSSGDVCRCSILETRGRSRARGETGVSYSPAAERQSADLGAVMREIAIHRAPRWRFFEAM